ncbi:helix-turn-helix domain-containing protein [Beduini massiliensis]|uniref:helix-turn-helix domain-containing protein n=1 Tax=Beduini massiliensis TaxID=1585974 RepID=UPI00059A90F1|nr:helix-turn-helix transcriptional regulator [Beduini massiliensis]
MPGILTKREKEIFELLINHYTTRDIAKKLEISEKTVRNHISNVIQKLGVTSRIQAVLELIKLNELKIE